MDKSRLNSIASVLLWLWGILILLSGIAVGYPVLATQGSILPMLAFATWGVVTCLAAFALRNRQWGVRWWGSVLCAVSALIMVLVQVKVSLIGAALNVGVLALILCSWNMAVPAKQGDRAGSLAE